MSFIENVITEINRLDEESFLQKTNESLEIRFKIDRDIATFLQKISPLQNYFDKENFFDLEHRRSAYLYPTSQYPYSSDSIEKIKKSAIDFIKKLSEIPWRECISKDREFFLTNISFKNYQSIYHCDFYEEEEFFRFLLEIIANIRNINIDVMKGYEYKFRIKKTASVENEALLKIKNFFQNGFQNFFSQNSANKEFAVSKEEVVYVDCCKNRIFICGEEKDCLAFFEALRSEASEFSEIKNKNARNIVDI